MSNNNKASEVIELNLSGWTRWKAIYRKYNGHLSDPLALETSFIKSLPDYKKNWIINGKGSPIAIINMQQDVKAALQVLINSRGVKQTIKFIQESPEDYLLFIDYCYYCKDMDINN